MWFLHAATAQAISDINLNVKALRKHFLVKEMNTVCMNSHANTPLDTLYYWAGIVSLRGLKTCTEVIQNILSVNLLQIFRQIQIKQCDKYYFKIKFNYF